MKRPVWADVRPLTEIEGIPLHQQLREIIRDKIKRGNLHPGDLVPSEMQLAEAYGISRTTARRALLDLTREGLLRRISGKGTYVTHPRTKGISAVAFVCAFNRWSMASLVEGIEAAVRSEGYELIVRNTQSDPDSETRQLREVMEMDVAGVILCPRIPDFSAMPSEAVRDLLEGPIPTVIVDQYTPKADCVTTDNFGGAYALTEHLLGLGRRRLGFVANPGPLVYTVQSRWAGMWEALLNHGASVGDRRLYHERLDPDRFARWLAEERLDGLLCANDELALRVIETLTQLGVSVPESVGVAGYDDLPFAQTMRPALTTVRQDFKAAGQSAGRMLVERIRGPSRPLRHINLPVRLVVRDSCGAGRVVRPGALPAAAGGLPSHQR